MCNDTLIEWMSCLCAGRWLLTHFVACVHQHNYWIAFLLICRPLIIDLFFCLCALLFVSRPFLLVCKGKIIEKFLCFCAIRVLLSSSIAYCVKSFLLNLPIAYVQSLTYVRKDTYRHYLLLVCSSLIIEHFLLLVCKSYFIEHFSCLGAVANLLTLLIACVQVKRYWIFFPCLCVLTCLLRTCFAWVHVPYYWHLKLLMCNSLLIDLLSCLDTILPLLNSFFTYVQSSRYWSCWLLMCIFNFIEIYSCLCLRGDLWNAFLIYVQSSRYWIDPLLICSYSITFFLLSQVITSSLFIPNSSITFSNLALYLVVFMST